MEKAGIINDNATHEEEGVYSSAEDDVLFAADSGEDNGYYLEESMRDNQDKLESSEYVAEDLDAPDNEEEEEEKEEERHGLIYAKQKIDKAMRHAKHLFIAKSSPADIEFFTNNILLLAQLKETFERETMELVHNFRQKLGKAIRNEDQEINEEPPQKKMNIEVVDLENSPIRMDTLENEPVEDHNE